MRIRDGLHRLGNGTVNVYLLADGTDVTIIDAGVPGYWGDLPAELAAMGRTLADVRAIVLTHGHSDHIGFAERARRERRIPVSVHELDAALAHGEVPNPARGFGPVSRRSNGCVPTARPPSGARQGHLGCVWMACGRSGGVRRESRKLVDNPPSQAALSRGTVRLARRGASSQVMVPVLASVVSTTDRPFLRAFSCVRRPSP
jgi:hypothetical protein